MNTWQQLSKIALLGTDRASLTEELSEELAKIQVDTTQDTSVQVLEAAATLSAMQRAGYHLESLTDTDIVMAPMESKQHCNQESVRHLATLLHRANESALGEFLFYMNENGKIIPSEFLPELLQLATKSQSLLDAIRPVLGERGAWLAAQNPDWQHLQHQAIAIDWANATIETKTKLIEYWRNTDPAEAIELLRFYWNDQNPRSKVRLIKALKTSLSLADEDFLEDCLNEKRKEVRIAAAKLLAQLEGAELQDRLFAKAKGLLQLKVSEEKGLKMHVELPDTLTETDIRDGLSLNMSGMKQAGALGTLFYMLSHIPPFYWEKHFKLNKEQLLESYVRSDWASILVQALIEATTLFEDPKWMPILLQFWVNNQFRNRWSGIDISPLIPVLSHALFNKTATQLLQSEQPNLFQEKSFLLQLLQSTDHQWDASLSKAFINYLKEATNNHSQSYWTAMQFRQIIKNAAYRCPPKLYDTLQRLLPEAQLKWTVWEEDYYRFLKTLKFRKDMVEALEKE